MKAFNHFLGLFFITILIGMTSCTKQDLEIRESLAPTTKAASAVYTSTQDIDPIIVNNAAFNLPSDLFSAVDFTIEDEIIMLTASYPGGCGIAHFTLVADSQIHYNSNNTPIFNAKLILDNNDKCSYNIKKSVAFDLTPLQQTNTNQVVIKIADFGEINYNY